MPSMPVRVALIGYGLAGSAFHAPFIAVTAGLRLAAIVTANPDRQERAELDHPDAAVLASADELWERACDYDVAVVAAPNRAHVPLALAAFESGLAVVVDKPLAASAGDARLLAETARGRGLLLTVFQNRRWDGDFLTVRALIDEGVLGRVLRFESRFERWRPEVGPGWRERAEPEEAGGLLFDLGSHLVDQALQLFGHARAVYAELDRRRPGARVDDDVFVALDHASGVRSHLWASAVAADSGPRFRVLGNRAAYVKHGLDVQEHALRSGRRPNDPDWGREPEEHWGVLVADGRRSAIPTRPGNYGRFYEGLAASLAGGAPPPVAPEEAVEGLTVLEAARLSHTRRQIVTLGSGAATV